MNTMTPTQPPLTYNDLIDLHFLLEADKLFQELMAAAVMAGDVR